MAAQPLSRDALTLGLARPFGEDLLAADAQHLRVSVNATLLIGASFFPCLESVKPLRSERCQMFTIGAAQEPFDSTKGRCFLFGGRSHVQGDAAFDEEIYVHGCQCVSLPCFPTSRSMSSSTDLS